MILSAIFNPLFSYLQQGLYSYVMAFVFAFIFSISCHEMAHALAAYKLGDSTAKDLGRLTLNPFAHLNLYGTIMMIFLGIGYANPVPCNQSRLRKGKFSFLMVVLAGPLANFILASLSHFLINVLLVLNISVNEIGFSGYLLAQIFLLLSVLYRVNLSLLVFNMLPFPPLDGSHLWRYFLPNSWSDFLAYRSSEFMFGLMVIYFLIPRLFNQLMYYISLPFSLIVNLLGNYVLILFG